MDGGDPAQKIRINRPRQNDSVNKAMFLKNWREIDPVRRYSCGIVQRREQYMLLQSAGVGLNALQDASMEGMQKIAVAQEEAHHFCTPLENTAGLRVGAESE